MQVRVTEAGALSGAESLTDFGNVNEAANVEGPGFGAKAGTMK